MIPSNDGGDGEDAAAMSVTWFALMILYTPWFVSYSLQRSEQLDGMLLSRHSVIDCVFAASFMALEKCENIKNVQTYMTSLYTAVERELFSIYDNVRCVFWNCINLYLCIICSCYLWMLNKAMYHVLLFIAHRKATGIEINKMCKWLKSWRTNRARNTKHETAFSLCRETKTVVVDASGDKRVHQSGDRVVVEWTWVRRCYRSWKKHLAQSEWGDVLVQRQVELRAHGRSRIWS